MARWSSAVLLLSAFSVTLAPIEAGAQSQSASCYPTGGGALEICRGDGEAEGVFFTPRACELAQNVQIMRLPTGKRAVRPLQAIYQAETPARGRREADACSPDRRATNPSDGGSVRSGGQLEPLATIMPPTAYRLWETPREMADANEGRRRKRRGRQWDDRARGMGKTALESGVEEIGARNPMAVVGRDWAGDEYYYVFMVTTVPVEGGGRHALIQARTSDFEGFDLRSGSGEDSRWAPFVSQADRGRRRKRSSASPVPSAVLDEDGKPIVGNCAGRSAGTQGLVGSISVVDKVYHYFYTDVPAADCAEPALKQRTGLYLRTSRDLTGDRVWSAARPVTEQLPPQTLVRVAKAKGMDRWAVSYTCARPVNVMGGPIADVCVQYTSDISVGSLQGLTWYDEPVAATRSTSYLGLRSGGDDFGRYGRSQHFWMTDRYGNLDTPGTFPGKAGFLTWVDRFAPRQDGSDASAIYGRPVYWGTWSVRPVGAK